MNEEVFVFPTSYAQQRLWFLDQLTPGNPFYNVPAITSVREPLDLSALERSLNEIVRRHETLRTTFMAVDGQPLQVIAPTLEVLLPVMDLRPLPATDRETEARRLAAEEAERPFDLAQGPLLRTTLLRLDEQENLLLVTMHHIISDGWSQRVFLRELTTLYAAFLTEKASPLEELPIQYADYAVWQRQWLQGEVLHTQLAYWKRQLGGVPAVLQLPTDHPRPEVQTFRGAEQFLSLSERLSEALRALSRREGVTLFMTLLAAFQMLLHRYSGQDEIVVGSPIAGRTRAEIEGLIGFFINTLVLRTDLSGDPPFRELLGRVREVALGAYAHQDVPFEKLVEELRPLRDLSRTPMFQVFFNLLNFSDNTLDLPEPRTENDAAYNVAAKFDLTLYAGERDGIIQLVLVYNTNLFEWGTIRRMLGHFQTLLEGIVAHPEDHLSTLPLLTESEQEQLSVRCEVVSPKNPFIEFKQEEIEQAIPDRFEQQVKQYPKRLAIKTKKYEWTYETLNRIADGVAQAIAARRGIGEERIGLLFDHDAPMVAGLVGVLKAGKTYVPLDPSYPRERISYMLEDSQAGAIVTHSTNLSFARELTRDRLPIINIDDRDVATSADPLNLQISPSSMAYILYTSGSTGQMKGVMQNHCNVLHHIKSYTNNLHLCGDDRLTLLSSYSFDAAIMDIFGGLLNGATLYPMNIKEDGLDNLPRWLNQEQITIYHSTPTVYRYLLNALNGERFPKLRLVVLGGEEVLKRDVDLYKKHFPSECLFVNGLGPTEATVALQYFINKETEITGTAVPVGYPVEDTEVVLLNEAREEVAACGIGEITIRSAHVALGYWQKPELTRAVFQPDPADSKRRIYYTGDYGRLRADGSIEFVGRKDLQVKIRGHRIDVGEVETTMIERADIKEVVVVASADVYGDQRLVAYAVPRQEPSPTISELRDFLKAKLPEYMVPTAVVWLESLPLTPNGKLDRRALPVPEGVRPELATAYVAPQSRIERTIASLWQEVLLVEQVGLHDNFFDLGGHSLLLIRVHSKLREVLRKEISMIDMFRYPTVSALARYLGQVASQQPFIGQIRGRAEKQKEALRRQNQLMIGKAKTNE
jgi:amino acid adenylation domain-containing protein